MWAALPKQIVFAHRGSSAYAPENTLAAFELAIQQHAEAIELDVKLSLDEQPVVIHDPTVDRTTDGTGKVRELSLAALRELDAGNYFDVVFTGLRIPTLAEVFETVGHKIFINIELTDHADPNSPLTTIVADLVKKYALAGEVMFSSFDLEALRRIQGLLPETPCGLLTSRGKLAAGELSGARFNALHPDWLDVTPGLVQRAHQAHQRVHPYTVNILEELRNLFAMGVDGIFTDDPVLGQQARAEVQTQT